MSKKCLGCGVLLQSERIDDVGYAINLSQDFCKRCFTIRNYGKNSDSFVNDKNYLDIFNLVTDDDLVVYVSSILTVNVDYISRFKKVLLVLTKRDILPKSVKDGKIINYLKKRYDNILDIVIVSSYKKYNLDFLYNKLNEYGSNRNIYFMGITNSGKSSLLNEMINSYGDGNGIITTSNYPATTLDVIEINLGNLVIKDTPGIVLWASVINYLSDKEIKMINPKKEIKPKTFQIRGSGVRVINDIIRIEYETDKSSMTFYMANSLDIKMISLNNLENKYDKMIDVEVDDNSDVVIEDLGFIKCTNKLKLRIYYRDSLIVSVRDNLI